MAPGKKNADDLGAHLVFLDESGFLLTPQVRRTWAPRGCTPVLRHLERHDKVSAISALTVSPKRRRLALYFQCIRNANFGSMEVAAFLRHLLRHLRGPIVVVLDNGGCHKGAAMREFLRRHHRVRLEPLPPYAPELNPDEGVWNQAKAALANSCPTDAQSLGGSVEAALTVIGASQRKLRWCVHQSDLPPFLS